MAVLLTTVLVCWWWFSQHQFLSCTCLQIPSFRSLQYLCSSRIQFPSCSCLEFLCSSKSLAPEMQLCWDFELQLSPVSMLQDPPLPVVQQSPVVRLQWSPVFIYQQSPASSGQAAEAFCFSGSTNSPASTPATGLQSCSLDIGLQSWSPSCPAAVSLSSPVALVPFAYSQYCCPAVQDLRFLWWKWSKAFVFQ